MDDERSIQSSDAKQSHHFDGRTIDFPSDRLTIKILRHQHPDAFDTDLLAQDQPTFFLEPESRDHASDIVGGMLYTERLIAARAWAAAQEFPMEQPVVSWEELKQELAERYVQYGLTAGLREAAELIRNIERQSERLAQGIGR